MVKNRVFITFMLCACLIGCSNNNPSATSSVLADSQPNFSVTEPTKATTLPLPSSTATVPQQAEINDQVTPKCTESFEGHKVIHLTQRGYATVCEMAQKVSVSQTVVDNYFLMALNKYEDDDWFSITVCYYAMLTDDDDANEILSEKVKQRFEDAGYQVIQDTSLKEYALFRTYATKRQILDLYCGDDFAIFIATTDVQY